MPAFIYAGILLVLRYVSNLCKNSFNLLTYITAIRLRSGLATLLYSKILGLSSFVIKSSELGKITNLLASDLGIFEQRLIAIIISLGSPIIFLGSIIILVIRIGWPALIGIIFCLLSLPILRYSSKLSA